MSMAFDAKKARGSAIERHIESDSMALLLQAQDNAELMMAAKVLRSRARRNTEKQGVM